MQHDHSNSDSSAFHRVLRLVFHCEMKESLGGRFLMRVRLPLDLLFPTRPATGGSWGDYKHEWFNKIARNVDLCVRSSLRLPEGLPTHREAPALISGPSYFPFFL